LVEGDHESILPRRYPFGESRLSCKGRCGREEVLVKLAVQALRNKESQGGEDEVGLAMK